jgi:thiamine biosynthesis lipoprotein
MSTGDQRRLRKYVLPLRGRVAAVALGLLLFGGGCEISDPSFSYRFLAFGDLIDVNIVQLNRQKAEAAAAILEKDFAYMQVAWDPLRPGSLERTNRLLAETRSFAAPPSILPLLKAARRQAEASEHLFNPAAGRLRRLWGFHVRDPDCHEPPSAERIARLVAANPRLTDIEIENFHLSSRNPQVLLDFSAITKGYSFDHAMQRMQELGVRNAMISSGGDLSAIGSRDGRPWRGVIRSPSGGIYAYAEIGRSESMFTAADHKRNYSWEGTTYHDILDPRTGYPARGSRSVTVIHPDATTADVASTALFIAGPSDWHRIARKMGVRFVMLLDSEGALHMNPAMKARIRLLDDTRKVVISPPLS